MPMTYRIRMTGISLWSIQQDLIYENKIKDHVLENYFVPPPPPPVFQGILRYCGVYNTEMS